MGDWSLNQELAKAGLTALVSAFSLCAGWFVGNRITAYWALRQKQRELDLAAGAELHRLYGEFFAVWKLWNYAKGDVGVSLSSDDADRRWELLERAALIDGGVEALLVRITSERTLTEEHERGLAIMRQRFQSLREAIRDDKPLPWHSSNHSEYVEFKEQAVAAAILLASGAKHVAPSVSCAQDSMKSITSNAYELRGGGRPRDRK